jgi:hypothetical protein
MPRPCPETSDKSSEKVQLKLRFGRVLLIYVVFGSLLGISAAWLHKCTSIPSEYIGGAVTGGGVVLLGVVLNWLVRSGYAPWLVRHE